MSVTPNFNDFKRNYDQGKSQVAYMHYDADFETALSVYYKLCGDNDSSLLLESVEGGAHIGRYSIIASQPDRIWSCFDDEITTADQHGNIIKRQGLDIADHDASLKALREEIAACQIDVMPDHLPSVCSGGMFGYLGYEMVQYFEPSIQTSNPDTLDIPNAIMMRPKLLAVFDNVKHQLTLAVPVLVDDNQNSEAAFKSAKILLEKAADKLSAPLKAQRKASALEPPLKLERNFTDQEFEQLVDDAKEHIFAGDIFQMVPSQRFTTAFDLPAIELYRSLRRINPSPFLFHLKLGDLALVGSSPEILVRVRDDEVTVRPIAGTRPRGNTPEEDKALADDLLADEKERAEHLMLIDLGRNDVGRISEIGSVRVTESFVIERYSHVMHIVSNVVGKLRKDHDCIDALFSGFPAGTVSGAPKIRAMQLINKFEKEQRRFYAGCVGYFDGRGNMDTCIALRTALLKDNKLTLQAGAGIVADSNPASENQECKNKAMALVKAAEASVASLKF